MALSYNLSAVMFSSMSLVLRTSFMSISPQVFMHFSFNLRPIQASISSAQMMFCFSDFPHWWPLLKDHDQSQARGFHANHSRVFHPCMFAICIHTREYVLGNAEFVSNGTPPFMVNCHTELAKSLLRLVWAQGYGRLITPSLT